jgi:hypothetical protein
VAGPRGEIAQRGRRVVADHDRTGGRDRLGQLFRRLRR